MNLKFKDFSQFFLRMAISSAFLSAVFDRFGLWGIPGSKNVSWGNWENFLQYSNKLNFYAPPGIAEGLAIAATFLEVVFAIMLIGGYKTREAALGSGVLLSLFGITMTLALGIKSTFTYSVWIGAGASFLLASLPTYKLSIDQSVKKANS